MVMKNLQIKISHFFAAKNCYDIYTSGSPLPGIYDIPRIGNVKCLENGWTSIQHRGQYGNPSDYFSRNCSDYVEGFGSSGRYIANLILLITIPRKIMLPPTLKIVLYLIIH